MSDEEAFLATVCTDPDDRVARLVFADWLEEHDAAGRAAMIRAAVELDCAWLADPPDGIALELYSSPGERREVVDWASVAPASATFAAARIFRGAHDHAYTEDLRFRF